MKRVAQWICFGVLVCASTVIAQPGDPSFPAQWPLQNTGQTGGLPGADISAVEAWELAAGASEVIVGIIDTGLQYDHPDLVNRLWTNPDEIAGNGIDDDGNGYVDDVHGWRWDVSSNNHLPGDSIGNWDYSHGTSVAGIIAAEHGNDLGIAGVAPNARLMMLGIGGSAWSETDMIDAMMYAMNEGAKVINISLYSPSYHALLEDTIELLNTSGVVVVACAGNKLTNMDEDMRYYPACYDAPNLISVANSLHDDQLFDDPDDGSNFGFETVDLAAPGTSSLALDMNGGYTDFGGTSGASPHVAGAAAVLLGLYPDLTPAEVRSIIMDGTSKLPQLTRKVGSGGRLNMVGMLQVADPVPPGVATDLQAISVYANTAVVRWTAVGNDGYEGTALRNDLRYSLTPILTEQDFAAATTVHDLSSPQAAGATELLTVQGLDPATTYYFGLRVGDRGGNWSPIATATATTTDLSVAVVDETPLQFTAHTGESLIHQLTVENDGPGSLSYRARAISLGASKSRSASPVRRDVRVGGEGAPEERASGADKEGPSPATRFKGHFPGSADKSADWGTLFYDAFDADTGFWTTDVVTGSDLWHYTTSAYGSPDQSLAFTDQVTGDYDTGAALDVSVVSGSIDLTGAQDDAVLEFLEWYSTELDYDHCDVEISSDGGQSWSPLRTGVSGDSEGWRLTAIDIGAYAGQVINVRFRFHTDDDLYNDYPGWYVDDVTVRDQGAPWISFIRGVGDVPAYGSTSIVIGVSAEGLCSGSYDANIHIQTNDPAHALFVVPVGLTVNGASDIYYAANSLDLGTVSVGYSSEQILVLENQGCDPLTISGLTSTAPEFSPTLSASTIPPGESADLSVTFSPSVTGFAGSFISFATNDPDSPSVTLMAMGSGRLAPVIAVPDTVSGEVEGELVHTLPFEIRNDGDSDLTWQFARNLDAAGEPVAQPRVLFDTDQFNMYVSLEQRAAELGYDTSDLGDRDPGDQLFTDEVLDDADVVVLYGFHSYTAEEMGAISAWVADGGGLLFEFNFPWSVDPFDALMDSLGTNTGFLETSEQHGEMTPASTSAMADGIDIILGEYESVITDVNSPMMPFVSASTGEVVQAYGTIGKGRVFLATNRFSEDGQIGALDNMALAENVLSWLASDDLTMEPSSGTLAAGNSQVVDLRFDSSEILDDSYEYAFSIVSDDPATPVAVSTALLTVDGTGHVHLEDTTYDFGVIDAARDTTVSFRVWNTGNGPVGIDLSSNNSRISPKLSTVFVAPKGWQDIKLMIDEGAEGPIAAELSMLTDAPGQSEITVLLAANPQRPHVQLSTTDLGTVNLYTGETQTLTFDVTNTGLWPLEYSFSSSVPNRFIPNNNASGTVDAGASVTISVNHYAGTDCGSPTFAGEITIASNSPDTVPAVQSEITVTDAPRLEAPYQVDIFDFPDGLRFGTTENVAFSNSGCADLDITHFSLEDDPSGYFTILQLPAQTLAPGEGGEFRVVFTAPDFDSYYATLKIFSNDQVNPAVEIVLAGHGDLPPGSPTLAKDLGESLGNYPNPFNPATTISFYAPIAGNAEVRIYNIRGRLVRLLDAGAATVGRGFVEWNGRDQRGLDVASGVYFYRLHIDGRHVGGTGRATMLK